MLGRFVGHLAAWRFRTYGARALYVGDTGVKSGEASAAHEAVLDEGVFHRPVVSAHRPVLTEGLRWRCLSCMASAESVAAMGAVPCIDKTAEAATPRLLQCGALVFCGRCGLYSEKRVRQLKALCAEPKCPSQVARLKAMKEGRHPVHRYFMGRVQRHRYQEEWLLLSGLLEEPCVGGAGAANWEE